MLSLQQLKHNLSASSAYFQVIQSFFNFKVVWPKIIKSSITFMYSIATVISFDLVAWPGFGCLVEMKYETKLYLRTILSCIIGLLMRVPVLVLKWKKYILDKKTGQREQKIAMTKALLESRSYFWNNLLTWWVRHRVRASWQGAPSNVSFSFLFPFSVSKSAPLLIEHRLFLVYPTTSLTSLQVSTSCLHARSLLISSFPRVFELTCCWCLQNDLLWWMQFISCVEIGGISYLNADLRELCPTSGGWGAVAIWYICMYAESLVGWSVVSHSTGSVSLKIGAVREIHEAHWSREIHCIEALTIELQWESRVIDIISLQGVSAVSAPMCLMYIHRSLLSSLLWATGVPIFTYVVMQKHEVPQMAQEKQVCIWCKWV